MSARDRKIGIVQIALSGICFGFLGVFGKALFARGVAPGELLSLRFLLSALVLFPVIRFRFAGGWKLRPAEIATCAALGIGGYALFSSCFFMALRGLSASLAVLLLYTYPVMVAGLGWVLFGDEIPRRKWIAVPLAMLGLVLLVWGEFSFDRLSSLTLGVASAVFYSAYILVSSRRLAKIPPLVSVSYILLFAGMTLTAIHLRSPARMSVLITQNWPVILGIVAIGTVAAMSLFLAGLQKLRAWEVSLLSTLEPLTGVLLATVFLGERLRTPQILGAFGVIGALIFISLPSHNNSIISNS